MGLNRSYVLFDPKWVLKIIIIGEKMIFTLDSTKIEKRCYRINLPQERWPRERGHTQCLSQESTDTHCNYSLSYLADSLYWDHTQDKQMHLKRGKVRGKK